MKLSRRSQWLIILFLCCELVYLVSYPLVLKLFPSLTQTTVLWIFTVLFLVSGLVLIALLASLVGQIQEEEKKEAMIEIYKIRNEQIYCQMKAEANMKKLSEKLQAILEETPSLDGLDRATVLLEQERDGLYRRFCFHPLINAILLNKSQVLQKNRIPFSVAAAVPAVLEVDSQAVLSVLFNLIDNAMEAVLKFPDPCKHPIELNLHVVGNFLIIAITNDVQDDSGLYTGKSSKSDPTGHGLELSIIESACKKNNGWLHRAIRDGQCEFIAALAIKRKEEAC